MKKPEARKKAILLERDEQGDWAKWQVVTILEETENTWKIRAWWCPFGFRFHKQALGLRITNL